MGWNGGTQIFDTVANELDYLRNYVSLPQHSEGDYFKAVLVPLLCTLEDMDWDNHQESDYWEHPIVGAILGNEVEGLGGLSE